MLNKKALFNLSFWVLGFFFLWSCEEKSKEAEPDKSSGIVIKSLLNDSETKYTFYLDSFVYNDALLYDPGRIDDVDDDLIKTDWDKVVVRWGFRKRTSRENGKIYWFQTTQGDQDSQNSYESKVGEREKALFVPEELPSALLNDDTIEVYAVAEINEQRLTGALRLPDDFKEKVLGASVVEGLILNKTARDNARPAEERIVEGAAIFFVHRNTGNIFQTHSAEDGRFRGTIQYKDSFYMVVLRQGFKPYIKGIAIPRDSANNIVDLEESSAIKVGTLYTVDTSAFSEVTDGTGYRVSGIAVDTDPNSPISGKGLAQTFLLLYDRDFSSNVDEKEKVYFLESDDTGSFSFNMPLPATVDESDNTTVSVAAAAYGYLPSSGSERIGESRSATEIFGTIGFELNQAFNTPPVLAWGKRSSGGPSDFAYPDENGEEVPIPLHYENSAITVNLELEVKGIFLPDPLSVTWRVNNVVDSSKTGLSASFDLNRSGRNMISAEVIDIRKQKVVLTRSFQLSSSSDAEPSDPAVKVGADEMVGGVITSSSVNSDGVPVINVAPNAAEVYFVPDVEAIDPDTGDGVNIRYTWVITDSNSRTNTVVGQKPLNLRLWAGKNDVELTVTSADGNSSITLKRIYQVGAIP